MWIKKYSIPSNQKQDKNICLASLTKEKSIIKLY